jgi:hypothetical protein
MGQITGEAKYIVVLEVDRVSREKQVIIWKKAADLKGKYPNSVLKHHVATGNDERLSRSRVGNQAGGRVLLASRVGLEQGGLRCKHSWLSVSC